MQGYARIVNLEEKLIFFRMKSTCWCEADHAKKPSNCNEDRWCHRDRVVDLSVCRSSFYSTCDDIDVCWTIRTFSKAIDNEKGFPSMSKVCSSFFSCQDKDQSLMRLINVNRTELQLRRQSVRQSDGDREREEQERNKKKGEKTCGIEGRSMRTSEEEKKARRHVQASVK